MSRILVTGTGTEVGKTVVTAAIATLARDAGRAVCVVKPAQTGVGPGDESDVDVVRRLAGVDDVRELVRYDDPLAPASAARRQGVRATPMRELADRITALTGRDLVLVEGAGGLLVRLDDDGNTFADLARVLDAPVLVVAAAGLGTLNATALTVEVAQARGLHCLGVVVGAWPSEPDLAARINLTDLPSYAGVPLLGCVPAGLGGASPAEFVVAARSSLALALGGIWSPAAMSE
jgi:dethiobiotin synthetase